jgi:hypothetical protein
MPRHVVLVDRLPEFLRHALIHFELRDGVDLRMRQLALFLICYRENGPHTVRSLAAKLRLPPCTITHVSTGFAYSSWPDGHRTPPTAEAWW